MSTNGPMEELLLEIGRITRCMVVGSLLGLMVGSTKESTLKTKSKALAHSIGQMEGNMLANGLTANNMEKELS